MLRLLPRQAGRREALAPRRPRREPPNTDALHSIISHAGLRRRHIYGVDSYGELRCLDAATGDRLWEDLTAVPKARWSTIHFVKNGDKYWLFNERGELIIAQLSPQGFHEISRTKLIDPTHGAVAQPRRRLLVASGVCQPAHLPAERQGAGLCELGSKVVGTRRVPSAPHGVGIAMTDGTRSVPTTEFSLEFSHHDGPCAACCCRRKDAATASGTDPLRRLRRSGGGSRLRRPASLDGVWGSACALVAAGLATEATGPLVVVCPTQRAADDLAADLALFSSAEPVLYPAWESEPDDRLVHDETFGDRLRVLKQLLSGFGVPGSGFGW